MRDTRGALFLPAILSAAMGLATSVASAQDAARGPEAPADATGGEARSGEPRESEQPAQSNPPENGVLRLGAAAVSRMKKSLHCHERWMGRAEGPVTDAELPAVIERYQRDFGLPATGKLDLATLDLLGVSATVAVAPETTAFRPAPTVVGAGAPDTVGGGTIVLGRRELRAIEERLVKDGVYDGPPRGEFSPELEAALRKFQAQWGIKPAQGLIDLRTLSWFPTTEIRVLVDGPGGESLTLPASARETSSAASPAAATAIAAPAVAASSETPGARRIAPRHPRPAPAPRPAMRVEPIEWVCPCCQEPVGQTAPECGRCRLALGEPESESEPAGGGSR